MKRTWQKSWISADFPIFFLVLNFRLRYIILPCLRFWVLQKIAILYCCKASFKGESFNTSDEEEQNKAIQTIVQVVNGSTCQNTSDDKIEAVKKARNARNCKTVSGVGVFFSSWVMGWKHNEPLVSDVVILKFSVQWTTLHLVLHILNGLLMGRGWNEHGPFFFMNIFNILCLVIYSLVIEFII